MFSSGYFWLESDIHIFTQMNLYLLNWVCLWMPWQVILKLWSLLSWRNFSLWPKKNCHGHWIKNELWCWPTYHRLISLMFWDRKKQLRFELLFLWLRYIACYGLMCSWYISCNELLCVSIHHMLWSNRKTSPKRHENVTFQYITCYGLITN